MKDFMKINENDNVIVALKEMKKGEKTHWKTRRSKLLKQFLPDIKWQ